MPIHVIARVRAKPGLEGTVEVALKSLVAPSRAEAGCVRYELYRGVDDPHTFAFLEIWADDAAYQAHKRMPHVQAALEKAGPFIAEAPEIRESAG